MIDKTIFRTTIDRPIHTGKVIRYNPDKMTGFIRTDKGDELFFKHSSPDNELIQVGDFVIFSISPSIKIRDSYYAKNVQKAYLSEDNYLVSDDKWSHVHEGLKDILPLVIQKMSCNGREYIKESIKFKKIIGNSACVSITWKDEIVYAKRIGRERYTKFVKNRELIPTESVSIFLKKKQSIYLIKSCYYGQFHENDDSYNFDSLEDERLTFWNDHALVFGSEPIHPETITSFCPWTGINENNKFGSLFKNFNLDDFERRA